MKRYWIACDACTGLRLRTLRPARLSLASKKCCRALRAASTLSGRSAQAAQCAMPPGVEYDCSAGVGCLLGSNSGGF
jgi:hypothetical protein